MRHPVAKVYITQKFGANPDSYKKFGYLGHNGLDYRAFLEGGERCYESGVSKVYAPHHGKVIENSYDADGYGYYIKIENDKEGSILAHMHGRPSYGVGSVVSEGELIGTQGTTGNSTGIHLHWGYYTLPRNRANGYGGMINQEPLLLATGGSMPNEYKGLDLENQESMKVAVDMWYAVVHEKAYTKITQAEIDKQIQQTDKAGYDRGYKEGYDTGYNLGKSSVPQDDLAIDDIDLTKWEENGVEVKTTVGNKVITRNFRRK